MATTKTEQETIIRWDQEERVALLYTAYPTQARQWAKLGYPVEIYGRSQAGGPRSWRARVPFEALRWRRMRDGQIETRPRGRSIAIRTRKLAGSDDRSLSGRQQVGFQNNEAQHPQISGRTINTDRRGARRLTSTGHSEPEGGSQVTQNPKRKDTFAVPGTLRPTSPSRTGTHQFRASSALQCWTDQQTNQLERALHRLIAEIQDGLRHGHFEYTLTCEVIGKGGRRLVLHAGKSYQFVIPADDCQETDRQKPHESGGDSEVTTLRATAFASN
jgi:hypothetical protein